MTLPSSVIDMLEQAGTAAGVLPATEMYCEGWMLRLVLHAASTGIRCLPFSFAPGARWFSEASLYTAFGASTRSDRRAERFTRADAVIGHFDFKVGTKTGVVLRPDATQFVVFEAKMGNRLSAGVSNAATFDQAARNVACIAHALSRSKLPPADINLGFYVVAPEQAIQTRVFDAALPRWTGQNRPFVDTSKPAISG